MKRIKITYLIIIIMLLLFPSLMTIAGIELKAAIDEFSPKPAKPFYHGDAIKFTKQYYKYFTKCYYGRDIAIFLYNTFVFKITGQSPVPNKVLIGKDNHLFLCDYGIYNSINDYQGCIQLSSDELKSIYVFLETFTKWCDTRGILCYWVIAPDKQTIYYDKLPDSILQFSKTTADQIVEYLSSKNIPLIDLRPKLIEEKQKHVELFYKTDSHWNKLGAYLAYSYIIKVLSTNIKILKPVEIDIQNIKYSEPVSGGDLYRMMGVVHYPFFYNVKIEYPVTYTTEYQEQTVSFPKIIITRSRNKKLPKLVMYHDSCADLLKPLLSNNFSEAYYIFDYVWKTKQIDTNMIEKIKPDVVLIEIIERYWKYIPKNFD